MRKMLIASCMVAAAAFAAPTASAANINILSDHDFRINDDEDFLEQLIELDADDIEEIREEMADARADIADAMLDIEEAREEASSVPGGKAIANAVMDAVSLIVSKATREAFQEVRDALSTAETDLAALNDISDEERAETNYAIEVIREEMATLEDAIDELMDALRD